MDPFSEPFTNVRKEAKLIREFVNVRKNVRKKAKRKNVRKKAKVNVREEGQAEQGITTVRWPHRRRDSFHVQLT